MANETKFRTKLLSLIAKIQSRVSRIGLESAQNRDSLATLADDTRLKIGALQEATFKQKEEANRAWELNASRAKNEVDAMYALRDSVQKGFTAVAEDVADLLKTTQRLNERTGLAESKITAITETLRYQKPSVIDQSIVNSKIAGVYEVTSDLEARLQLIEDFREKFIAYQKSALALSQIGQ